jgi:hypothetical protein
MADQPSPTELLLLEKTISRARLESYRNSNSETYSELIAKHFLNIALSEALYPVLHNFEIAMRNSFYQAVAKISKADWLRNVDLNILCPLEAQIVNNKKIDLQKKIRFPSNGDLIANLGLGFWTSLTYSRYENEKKLYPRLFNDREFFPYIPKQNRKRRTLSERFSSIHKLRNQISHHESILKRPHLQSEYDDILEAINWINPLLCKTSRTISRFPDIFQNQNDFCEKIILSMESHLQSERVFERGKRFVAPNLKNL